MQTETTETAYLVCARDRPPRDVLLGLFYLTGRKLAAAVQLDF